MSFDAVGMGTWLAVLGTGLFWLVAVVLLIVGAFRRHRTARMLFSAAALVQFVAGPLCLAVAFASFRSFAEIFGAERMAFDWMLQAAPAGCVGWFLVALADAFVGLAPVGNAEPTARAEA